MTGLDLDALEAVARAATPGPWNYRQTVLGMVSTTVSAGDGSHVAYPSVCHALPENATHIATFDPPTVLTLIARVREEQQKRAEAEAVIARIEQLCAETDVDTTEATQAWLVGNIGAVLASYKTTNDENGKRARADEG